MIYLKMIKNEQIPFLHNSMYTGKNSAHIRHEIIRASRKLEWLGTEYLNKQQNFQLEY